MAGVVLFKPLTLLLCRMNLLFNYLSVQQEKETRGFTRDIILALLVPQIINSCGQALPLFYRDLSALGTVNNSPVSVCLRLPYSHLTNTR